MPLRVANGENIERPLGRLQVPSAPLPMDSPRTTLIREIRSLKCYSFIETDCRETWPRDPGHWCAACLAADAADHLDPPIRLDIARELAKYSGCEVNGPNCAATWPETPKEWCQGCLCRWAAGFLRDPTPPA